MRDAYVLVGAVVLVLLAALVLEPALAPDQVQVQDRAQVRDPSMDTGTPDMNRTQDQNRTFNYTWNGTWYQNRTQLLHMEQEWEQERARIGNQVNLTGQGVQVQTKLEAHAAVQSMVGLNNSLCGCGDAISLMARQYNASLQEMNQLEQRIAQRSGFARFFAGGDEQAARQLEQLRISNQERLQQMEQAATTCGCITGLQQQFQVLQQEQLRVMTVAANEQQDKGLFGWLWK